MIRQEDVYPIGQLGKPHGVKGEISFWFTDDVFDRVDADWLLVEIDGILVPFFMEEYRFRADELALVKFEDVDTEARARELTGCKVYFPRAFADAVDDHLTWAQTIGYQIIDAKSGVMVGVVSEVDDSTANTLFHVSTPEEGELLIPVDEELITDIDKTTRHITMNLPEGLLDL